MGWMLRWLLITAIAGVMTEYAVRALLARIRLRWRSASGGASWTKCFLANSAIEVLALASMFLVVSFMSDHWLPERGAAASIGAKILSLFFWWRITVMFLKVCVRPDDAECRIVAVSDADAKLLARALSLLILAYEVGDSWMHLQTVAGMPVKALSVAVLIDNIYSSAVDLSFIWFTRHATARWLSGLVAPGKGVLTDAKKWLAAHWVVPALMFEVAMSAVQFYGSITGNVVVSLGLSATLQAILMLLLFESAMDLPGRLAPPAPAGAARAPRLGELVASVLRMFGRLAFVVFVLRFWAVEALNLVSPENWAAVARNNIATVV
ncbi:MAG: hypothetical protein ACREIP_17420, partial [Alphaproteobacteria bacterium]